MKGRLALVGMVVLGLPACVPDRGLPAGGEQRSAADLATRPTRTLVMISPGEVPSFADKQILPAGAAVTVRMRGKEIVNAKLALPDEQALP